MRWPIYAVLFSTLLTSSAQIFWKIGVDGFIWSNIIIGFMLYAVATSIFIISLKYGELSVLYPVYATGFVWVGILSFIFLGEIFNVWKYMGMAAVIVGVALIGGQDGN